MTRACRQVRHKRRGNHQSAYLRIGHSRAIRSEIFHKKRCLSAGNARRSFSAARRSFQQRGAKAPCVSPRLLYAAKFLSSASRAFAHCVNSRRSSYRSPCQVRCQDRRGQGVACGFHAPMALTALRLHEGCLNDKAFGHQAKKVPSAVVSSTKRPRPTSFAKTRTGGAFTKDVVT